MDDFVGSKVALFLGDKLVVYLRDNKPNLRFSGMYDFPGGGREDDESPIECAIREVNEEFGIKLKSNSFIWQKEYPAMHDPTLKAYFLVAKITEGDIENIKFGEEGQSWMLMNIDSFLKNKKCVPDLKVRLSDYLEARPPS